MSKAEQKANEAEKQTGGVTEPVATPRIFRTKKVVSRTVVKLETKKPKYLRIDSKIEVGKQLPARPDPETGEMKQEKPAMTANVQDMETDTAHILLCNSVLHSELIEHYPDDSYIGKIFQIENLGKMPGKRYMTYSIVEVE